MSGMREEDQALDSNSEKNVPETKRLLMIMRGHPLSSMIVTVSHSGSFRLFLSSLYAPNVSMSQQNWKWDNNRMNVLLFKKDENDEE